jgi:hypothetical protein
VAVGSDLVFAFRPSGDAVTFVIHLDTPELSLPVVCEVGKNAERRGDLVVYGLKGGTLDPAGRPVPWPLYREWIDGALPVQWRVEARDASGTAVGVSTSHRLLIMDGRSGS